MATTQITPAELVEVIEDLRTQRAKADVILAGPFVGGDQGLWVATTEALIETALGEFAPHVLAAFRKATGPISAITPCVGREITQKANRDSTMRPKLPSLEEAISQAEKRLRKMTSATNVPSPVAPPDFTFPTRTFAAVGDFLKLRAIAQRDYRELRLAAYFKSVKSQATLAGSVTEAVLFDRLLRASVPAADLERLTLGQLYNKAKDLGAVVGRGSSAAGAVRDLRNFVHAGVEFREGELTEADANLTQGLMFVVLQELGIDA